jgi:hypothetical protein
MPWDGMARGWWLRNQLAGEVSCQWYAMKSISNLSPRSISNQAQCSQPPLFTPICAVGEAARTPADMPLQKTPHLSQGFPCLSRAYLGKKIVFPTQKTAQKRAYSAP